MLGFSEFINSGRVMYLETIRDVWAETNREFKTDYKPLEVAKQLMGTVGNKGDKKPEK